MSLYRTLKSLGFFIGLLSCWILVGTSSGSMTSSGTIIQSLDGEWQSARDLADTGKTEKWFDPTRFPSSLSSPINVPGSVTEVWPISTWWTDAPTNIVWYSRSFPLEMAPQSGMRYYLRFGAVKRASEIWFNDKPVGTHEG